MSLSDRCITNSVMRAHTIPLLAVVLLSTTVQGCFFDSACSGAATQEDRSGICCWSCFSLGAFECYYRAANLRDDDLRHAQLERAVLLDLGWKLPVFPGVEEVQKESNFTVRLNDLIGRIQKGQRDPIEQQALLRMFIVHIPTEGESVDI